jgi:hypothetical protein
MKIKIFSEIKKKVLEKSEIFLVPQSLDIHKLKTIIQVLIEKTKYFWNKIKEETNISDGEKLQYYAEYMAFDYIFEEYGYEREIIEKAVANFKIKLVVKK